MAAIERASSNRTAMIDAEDSELCWRLDEGATKLESEDADLASLVRTEVFHGSDSRSNRRDADVSPRTVKRNWAYARAWLRREMEGDS
ncbi:MAG: ECF-type sigma factor [Pirellulaceae bacterium]